MVQIELGMLLAQILNFLILVFVLTKFAFKPLIKMLSERQAYITEKLNNAAKDQDEAKQIKQKYELQLAGARKQAQIIIDNAIKFADKAKEEILVEAKIKQKNMLKEVQDEIEKERKMALIEAKKEIANISIAIATKIIEKNLNYNAHADLIKEFINKLEMKKNRQLSC